MNREEAVNRIRVASDGPVARVTLARPDQKNALDRAAAVELLQAITSAAQHAGTRAILLDAAGSDFCAGADLKALAAMLDAPVRVQQEDAELLGRVFVAMRECPKPVVAAVQGRALAGGAGLATACDIVIAADTAVFGYPEVLVGFVPAMVMTMLRRAVGEKAAYDLVATGRRVPAAEAERMGLVSRVVPAADLPSTALELARSLADAPESSERLTKRLFYEMDGLSFRESIALGVRTNVEARATEDFRAAVRRFAGS